MLIAPQEALRIVLSNVRPLAARRVPLGRALHGYLAESVRSDRDQPPTDRSAMDGYAVRSADLGTTPVRLRLLGEVAAGAAPRLRVRDGACVAVLTGACVPPGADAVVPVELTQRDADEVVVRAAVPRGAHVRKRGGEARRGDVLLAKSCRLGPAEIGVCAMVGRAEVKIHSRPRAAVLCTGAELCDVGERVGSEQLRDSNGPALLAALAEQGIVKARRTMVGDDPGAIAASLRRAVRTYHVVLISGGVSVGRYDFVPEAVRRIGGEVRFHGVGMKPGKPTLYATLPDNRHLFGLPGNPVSALAALHEFAVPALRRLSGAAETACHPVAWVRLDRPARSEGTRTYFAPAQVNHTKEGPAAVTVVSQGSADIVAASKADGVVVVPRGTSELPAGTMVEFHPWKTLP
jgi:molybdenum cofactor synthesis domain-containing protein